jgi:hypothetical protein
MRPPGQPPMMPLPANRGLDTSRSKTAPAKSSIAARSVDPRGLPQFHARPLQGAPPSERNFPSVTPRSFERVLVPTPHSGFRPYLHLGVELEKAVKVHCCCVCVCVLRCFSVSVKTLH